MSARLFILALIIMALVMTIIFAYGAKGKAPELKPNVVLVA